MLIQDWLTNSTKILAEAGIATARLDAEIILAHTIRKPRTYLHAHSDEPLEERQQEVANARIDLRLDRVPVAYIIGHKEFYGRKFKVTTATLIPRPESEVLIEMVDEILQDAASLASLKLKPLRILDVGTGSGALGITIKCEHPDADILVTLLDKSRHALAVAKENAILLNADATFVQSDLLKDYVYSSDIIVANLPYVDPSWPRSPETNYEPAEALFADNHGLALIYSLILQTTNKLNRGGHLVIEADPVQHEPIKKLAKRHGLVLRSIKDYGISFNKIV